MEAYNHISYGEMISRELVLFSQSKGNQCFFRSTNSDSLYSISQKLSEINYPVLVAVDGSDTDYNCADDDTVNAGSQYYFMLLIPAKDDDPDDIIAKQKTAKKNAIQIQARMRRECIRYKNGLTCLVTDSFTIRGVGPVGNNLFGVIMGFELDESTNFTNDNTYWQDVDSTGN